MRNGLMPVCVAVLSLGVATACSRKQEPPANAADESPAAASQSAAAGQQAQATTSGGGRWSRDEQGTPASRTAERRAERMPSSSARELPRAGTTDLPAGTTLEVRLTNPISTADAHTGDLVTGELARAVEVNGRDVLAPGTRVNGQVVAATTSGRMSRSASLEIAMTTLILRNGSEVPITTSHFQRVGKGHGRRNAGIIAGGAAVGALVGQLAGRNTKSTAEGAAAGAAAGTAAAAATGQLDFTLQPGELMTFKLEEPARL